MATTDSLISAPAEAKAAPDKPPFDSLSSSQKRQWDRFAVGMKRYHDHFDSQFKDIYKFADVPERLGMGTMDFISYARSLSRSLSIHHQIEEVHIFPFLGERMPQFSQAGESMGVHLKQHEGIHDGLDKYDAFLKDVAKAPSTYDPKKLREIMDSFQKVLFEHLDEEVASLRGPNMYKYWTLKELEVLPF